MSLNEEKGDRFVLTGRTEVKGELMRCLWGVGRGKWLKEVLRGCLNEEKGVMDE